MAKQISPELKNVRSYLTIKLSDDVSFTIPEYQRAYSWEIAQCDKLIQDIENFIINGSKDPYFFGTIILDRSKNENNIDQRNLIDGQQRTTSFYLLLKAVLLNINEAINKTIGIESQELLFSLCEKRKDIFKILYGVDDDTELFNLIKDKDGSLIKTLELPLKSISINESYFKDFDAILHSFSFEDAEKFVYKIPRKQKDNKYTPFFRNFKFFYYKIKDKSPSQLNEFVKNFLDKCQVIEISSRDVEQAIVMFNSLNSSGLPLSDADVLSAQLYSKSKGSEEFKKKRSDFNSKVEELSDKNISNILDIFTQYMYILRAKDKNKEVSLKGVRKFFIEENRLDSPLSFVQNLTLIAENWIEVYNNFDLIKMLLKFNYNIRFFSSTYLFAHQDKKQEDIVKISECLLRLFTILELVNSGYSSKLFKQFLFEINLKLADSDISANEIFEIFKNHIYSNWTRKELNDLLNDYRGNLFVILNEYLYCRKNGTIFNFDEAYNIEHIMPASGRNIDSIRIDAGIESYDEFKDLVEQIGNKILLEENINKSISNAWFKTKKETSISSKKGYKDSKYQIAKALTNYPSDLWTKEDIKKASEKANERIINFIFGD